MQLSGIDLNLLVIFDALYLEGSVAGAARRVGLSPSGLSHSLGRLRELFEDPLFLRSGAGMSPTPRADSLAPHVQAALRHVRDAFDEQHAFDPAVSRQTFTLSASDDLQVMLLPSVLAAAERTATHVRVEVVDAPRNEDVLRSLARGEIDVALGHFDFASPAVHQEVLFETRIACLAREGHPRIDGKLALDQYLEEGHVAIRPSGPVDRPFELDAMLRDSGLERRVVSVVSSLEVAPLVVAQSDLICAAAERMVAGTAQMLGLQILDHPLPVPRQRVHAAWHDRTARSSAHRWFRELLRETIRTLTQETAPAAAAG